MISGKITTICINMLRARFPASQNDLWHQNQRTTQKILESYYAMPSMPSTTISNLSPVTYSGDLESQSSLSAIRWYVSSPNMCGTWKRSTPTRGHAEEVDPAMPMRFLEAGQNDVQKKRYWQLACDLLLGACLARAGYLVGQECNVVAFQSWDVWICIWASMRLASTEEHWCQMPQPASAPTWSLKRNGKATENLLLKQFPSPYAKYQYSRFVGPNPSAPKTLPSIKASTSGFLEMGRLVNRTQACVKADGNPEVIDSRD